MDEVNFCYKYCPKCAGLMSKRHLSNPQCEKCNFVLFLNVRAVVCGFAIKNGKVLLEKRAMEPEKGKWSVIGGFIDFGEQPEQALLREVKEEIGCDCKVGKLIGVMPVNYYQFKDETFCTLPIAYEIEIIGEPKTSNEVSEVKWFDLNALPDLAWGNQRKILESYIKK